MKSEKNPEFVNSFLKFSLKLNDRAYKYFFIAENCDKLLNEEQKAFLKLLTNNESNSLFSERLLNLVKEAKKNNQWRNQYMTWEREKLYVYEQGETHGREIGILEGSREKAIENAKNFLRMGCLTVEQIAQGVGLSVDEVLSLKNEV